MKNHELLCRLALTQLPGIGIAGAHKLLDATEGKVAMLFDHPKDLGDIIPGISPKIASVFDAPEVLRRCEAELSFAEKNHIACLTCDDEAYPSRLRECDGAPLVLFYRGISDLNQRHIISMVGTRNASAALQHKMETIGVLAHGLDRIYPSVHRRTAAEMTQCGGLLTEFMSGTNPDKQNFVKRNRIVAGISDATIVIESANKGGSLITAEIAESYHRDCFAFPGRINDMYSAGCNELIRSNRAVLLQSAEELIKAMNWDSEVQAPAVIQRQLFPELDENEEKIVSLLQKHPDGIQINTLVVESNIAINRMTGILFELEMKGIIRTLAGGVYKLI